MHTPEFSRRSFLARSAAAGAVCLPLARCTSTGSVSREPGPVLDRWQIGCYTRPFAAHEYRVAFDAIAEAGYRYVGLMTTKSPTNLVLSTQTPPEEAMRVGEEARSRGLRIPSAYCGEIPVGESLEAGIAGMRRLVENCAAAGAANLMMGGTADAALYERYYQAIAACCDEAASRGIGISVKPHGGLNATGPQCRKTLELVNRSNFRLWYDPGNIYYYSDGALDPVDDARTVDGLVVGMSVKDYLPPKRVDVTPGDGQVRFSDVMAALRRGGFVQGPLIVETLAPGELPFLVAEAKRARRLLEELTA